MPDEPALPWLLKTFYEPNNIPNVYEVCSVPAFIGWLNKFSLVMSSAGIQIMKKTYVVFNPQ